MKIFLDTSSLVKLYHAENETKELELLFSTYPITTIFLSEISKIEFASTIWKKVRTKDISENEAKITLDLFNTDLDKFTFIASSSAVIEEARLLTTKYGLKGLRTLDSIQLATAVYISSEAEKFITSDKLLNQLFEEEKLPTMYINKKL